MNPGYVTIELNVLGFKEKGKSRNKSNENVKAYVWWGLDRIRNERIMVSLEVMENRQERER